MFDVSRAICAVLAERRMSQRRLAEESGIRPDKLCRILKGRRKLGADELIAICSALSLSVEELGKYTEQNIISGG